MTSLVQQLFDGPLDIVGDVHGEIESLGSLLRHLGYSKDGNHPNSRRLVFVGDLTDRGPDSLAVVALVQEMVGSGRAQCILGNHDLNIVLDERKHDNKWFYGEEFLDKDGQVVGQRLASAADRRRVVDFFATLPLALERHDLRVVHACWDDGMIALAREANDAAALYRQYHEDIERSNSQLDIDDIDEGLRLQNNNPVKKLTSGPEERLETPFEASGKLRYEQRVPWWNDYTGAYCVFGHYSIPQGSPRGGESSFCVDFGVAKRWQERKAGKTNGFSSKLAALRWPEHEVMFDGGLVKSASSPSWTPGGGVVLEVHPTIATWELPSIATRLHSFHVTLIGRKAFLEHQEDMARVWPTVQSMLPLPPKAKLSDDVNEAEDLDRKTWYLHISNQDEFRVYVQELRAILDDGFKRLAGSRFENPERDGYFHMSVANNRGGDPLESIGSIRPQHS